MNIIDLNDEAWFDFVRNHPSATPFHHPAWARLLSDCYGYRAFVLASKDDDGKITAGLPVLDVSWLPGRHRWVSLPFTDRCSPLLAEPAGLESLSAELEHTRLAARIARLDVRDLLPGRHVHAQSQAVYHTLMLQPDAQAVFRTFKRTQVQQAIGQAEKNGIVVRQDQSLDGMRMFYRLHLRTRQRLGVPTQPWRYFALLWERFIKSGLGFLQIATIEDRPVAGAIFLTWNGTIIYKYSASDQRFLHLRPNNLVLWTAIRWGCEHGYQLFDWGRTDLDTPGLRSFKNGWGTQEHALVYSTLSNAAPVASAGRAKKILEKVIIHTPPFVSQLIGELLYKYAA